MLELLAVSSVLGIASGTLAVHVVLVEPRAHVLAWHEVPSVQALSVVRDHLATRDAYAMVWASGGKVAIPESDVPGEGRIELVLKRSELPLFLLDGLSWLRIRFH